MVRSETRGILLMVAGSFCFSLMEIFSKLALPATGVWALVFFRGLITSIFLLVLMQVGDCADGSRVGALRRRLGRWIGAPPPLPRGDGAGGHLRAWVVRLRGRNLRMLISRGIFGSLGLLCYMYAIAHLKLADAVILNKTSPVFVILFGALFLKERVTWAHGAALAAGFVGVYNIVKPDLHLQALAGLVGLSSAVFAAIAYLSIKRLTETDSPLTIVFYFTFISMLVPVPFLPATLRLPDGPTLLCLLGVGVSATAAQILMTLAYNFAPAGKVSMANYANALFAVLWGWTLFGEVQDGRSILGSALILASCLSLPFLRSHDTMLKR